MATIPGTGHLRRAPHIAGSTEMGIKSYGRSAVNGVAGCYKAPLGDKERLERLGYRIVKCGTGYCYAIKKGR